MAIMTSRRPLLAIRFQYLLYFGVLGIYLPYFNLYCYHLGFNGAQIGTLSAVRSVVMVIFSLAWGLLADRFQRRWTIYILCSAGSTLIWTIFPFYRRLLADVDDHRCLCRVLRSDHLLSGGLHHGPAGIPEGDLRNGQGLGLDRLHSGGYRTGTGHRLFPDPVDGGAHSGRLAASDCRCPTDARFHIRPASFSATLVWRPAEPARDSFSDRAGSSCW